MRKYRNLMTSASPRPFLIFAFLAFPMAALAQESQLAGREVTLTLLKQRAPSTTRLPEGEVKLITQKVTVRRTENIRRLLKANGIHLDANSLSLVYDLNPALDDAAAIKPGTILTLPRVTGGRALQKALSQGDLVIFTVDQKMKNELRGNIERLKELAPRVSDLDSTRFGNPEGKETTLRSIEGILGSLDVVRKGLILSHQFLVSKELLGQLAADAELLRTLLEGAVSAGNQLGAAQQEQIQILEQDLQVKMAAFNEARGDELLSRQDVRVVVKTIKPEDGSQVPNLRIYYAREAFYKRGEEKAFGKLSSPAEEVLPMGNYRMWARRDGNPSPVSEAIPVAVRKKADGNFYYVDLTINH